MRSAAQLPGPVVPHREAERVGLAIQQAVYQGPYRLQRRPPPRPAAHHTDKALPAGRALDRQERDRMVRVAVARIKNINRPTICTVVRMVPRLLANCHSSDRRSLVIGHSLSRSRKGRPRMETTVRSSTSTDDW